MRHGHKRLHRGPSTLPRSCRREVPLRMTDLNGIVEHRKHSASSKNIATPATLAPPHNPMKNSDTLPCNPAAEVAVLGAILLDNQCFNQAAAVIAEEDFSLDTHRRIYRAMA